MFRRASLAALLAAAGLALVLAASTGAAYCTGSRGKLDAHLTRSVDGGATWSQSKLRGRLRQATYAAPVAVS
jgi:hypothetical protein